MTSRTRVRAHQPQHSPDLHQAVAELRAALSASDTDGVDLVCFPLGYLGGYFPNSEADSRRVAFDLQSSRFDDVLAALGRFDATVVVGLVERCGDRLYNTAVVVRQGRCLGAQGSSQRGVLRGGPSLFEAGGCRFGINICHDANFSEAHGCAAVVDGQGQVLARAPEDEIAHVTHWV